MSSYRYCPICAKPLLQLLYQGKPYVECEEKHFLHYDTQAVGAAAIIVHEGKLLLEKRAVEPGKGCWGLLGGMAEPGEQITECVVREVQEESGLEIQITRLLDVQGGHTTCVVFYEAIVTGGQLFVSSESTELRWYDLSEIPYEQLAFRSHLVMIERWLSDIHKIK